MQRPLHSISLLFDDRIDVQRIHTSVLTLAQDPRQGQQRIRPRRVSLGHQAIDEMPHREASPALSENEFDISNALFAGGSDVEDNWEAKPKKKVKVAPSADLDMMDANLDGNGDDSDDDEGFIASKQASANRKGSNLKGRTVKKGGGFQAMGLNANLLKAITRKGFSVPTPIQRKTIPLVLDDKDVVGMARTGSGKTAAFVIPMIEKLRAHSQKVGARGLILSPSRELALQTLKVVKELGRGTDLKAILLIGGDSMEEQFSMIASNPDIIIATPGRYLHLKVEMNLDLSSIRYVVFDEADRLFEMGFAAQLTEILHALPPSRQTLLFSATLPKSLVEFARAGLQEPSLVRLDAESKVSPDLQSVYFSVKSAEKEGALLHILHDIIKMPTGETETARKAKEDAASDAKNSKKRKHKNAFSIGHKQSPTEHSTIIFTATKHHVDYIATLLRASGFATSHAYGSLDQTARRMQVEDFRNGLTNILVVTDVAARGIDIPILANVINYDFPSQPKIFVHRVGRTARAGQKGWSYSLVRDTDAPYLLDLQLFLGKKLVLGRNETAEPSFSEDVVVGSMAREPLSSQCEWVTKVLDEDEDLNALRGVAGKGEKLYTRTRNSASSESAKRAKEVIVTEGWSSLHPMFNDEASKMEAARESMLARIGGYRPSETIFEVGGRRTGKKGTDEAADAMKKFRDTFEAKKQRKYSEKAGPADVEEDESESKIDAPHADGDSDEDDVVVGAYDDAEDDNISMASSNELEVTFSQGKNSKKGKDRASFQDPENYMSYQPTSYNANEDRGYGVHSGSNSNSADFVMASRNATMDLGMDEASGRGFGEARGIMRWDKRQKKYVRRTNDEDGSRGDQRLVRGESGQKIAASFRSGRFDAWRKKERMGSMPRVGETEAPSTGPGSRFGEKRYRHKKEAMPKQADKYRDDYDKKKKKFAAAKERNAAATGNTREVRDNEAIRKARNLKEKRREKNARPQRKGKK